MLVFLWPCLLPHPLTLWNLPKFECLFLLPLPPPQAHLFSRFPVEDILNTVVWVWGYVCIIDYYLVYKLCPDDIIELQQFSQLIDLFKW